MHHKARTFSHVYGKLARSNGQRTQYPAGQLDSVMIETIASTGAVDVTEMAAPRTAPSDEPSAASSTALTAARIKSYWNYQGAGADWGCNVYVLQDSEGNVKAVNIQKCNLDDSAKAKSFRSSIERAVHKASPLPVAPDDAVFDEEIMFLFRVN